MKSTLLTGPRHTRLERRAFRLSDKNASDTLGSILYVVRNDARRSHVEDRWAKSYRPLRLRVETLDAVVRDLYEDLEGPFQELSGPLNRRLTEFALDETTAGTRGALAGEPASASLADAFSSRFSLFADAGIATPDSLADEFDGSALDDRIASATVDAYRQYRRLLEDHVDDWVCTRGHLFDSVATSEQPVTERFPELEVVIFSGYHEFRPLERDVVERIAAAYPTIAILPLHQGGHTGVDTVTTDALAVYESLGFEREAIPPDPGPQARIAAVTDALYRPNPGDLRVPDALQWRELPTPEREIRFVARELRIELAEGRDPDDLAVVIPGTEAYAGYVEDTFNTFDIPHVTAAASRLDRTFTGSIVRDLLALAEADPRAEDLTSLLANPLADLVASPRAAAITAAARRRDTVALDPVLDDVDDDAKALIEDLRATLEPLRSGDVGAGIDAIRRVLDETFHLEEAVEEYASGPESAVERQAYDIVDEVLESFESLQDVPSRQTPLALFTRAFDGVPIRVPRGATGGRIEVMGMLDARMRSFETVFVVGLTSEHFPPGTEQPNFFEEMTDGHPRFDTADERRLGRYLFATLVANAEDVTLTTPETGEEDSAIVRSPILDELQRVTGIEPVEGVDDRIGSREDLQRHLAAADDRRAAVSHAGDRGDLSPEQTKRTDRGLVCADSRSTAGLSRHDAVLDVETVETVYPPGEREPYSPSRIERYVECGFKFYAENVLEIEDPDDVEVTPTPLETGSYVHDVLERFYVGLQSESGDGIDVTAFDRGELEAHLLDTALEELERAEFDYDGLFYDRWLTELFAGVGDGEANPWADTRRPHDAPEQGLFAAFLDEEYSRSSTGRPRRFELPFGEGLPDSDSGPFEVERPDGTKVSIRGYIDRVDVNDDGDDARLHLYDYKTGRSPSMTKATGGTTFQLPIYLLAAEDVLSGVSLDEATRSATYYQVRPPNDIQVPRGVESKFDSQDELRQFLDVEVPKRLGTIDEAISNGRFHTTVLSAREANCRYCDYRRACDVRHHRKRERIAEAKSDGVAYVPLRVQDDVDLEAVMHDD